MLNKVIALKNKADSMISVGIPITAFVPFGRYSVDDQLAAVVAVKSADNIEKCGFT